MPFEVSVLNQAIRERWIFPQSGYLGRFLQQFSRINDAGEALNEVGPQMLITEYQAKIGGLMFSSSHTRRPSLNVR